MKINLIVRVAMVFALSLAPMMSLASNPKPFTVPELRQWTGADGTMTVPADGRICYDDASLAVVADNLAKDYEAITGQSIVAAPGKGGKGDIILSLKKNKKLGSEGYEMNIGDEVVITAPTVAGVRWGASTLLQLRDASANLPKGSITDFPDYGFRGFMIDAGRKYIPMDYLYKLVDILAYHKMNELHVHLNDNGMLPFFDGDWDKVPAAFRMECETYPGLTARDGSYTKKEFIEFQEYAGSRGVEIIPEIDFPAHSLAFTRYMPELACDGVENGRDHLNLDIPETYTFLDNLLKEYIGGDNPVFRGKRFHIGTDEYKGDSTAMESFRALTDRYIRYTEDFDKQPVVWGSLTYAKGSTPVKSDGVEMYVWYNGYAAPLDMIDAGYNIVSIPDAFVYIVPGANYYHDYLDTRMLYDEWTPAHIRDVVVAEKHPQLLGGMFAVWNDHPNNGITVRDIHHRVMAALPTMAAKTWNGPDVTVPYEEFAAKSEAMKEAPGVNYLARLGSGPEVVCEAAAVAPGSVLPIDEIGYNYTIEFDLEGADETPGTVLFFTPEATVWLSNPISGTMGYSRDNKLISYRHDIRKGEKKHYRITGDNKGTKLYIDGKLVDDMYIRSVSYDGGKHVMSDVSTLVFPLRNAGNFRSKVTNLKVKNYIEEK